MHVCVYINKNIHVYTCIHTYANVANLATCGHRLCPYVIIVHHMASHQCCIVLAHVWFHLYVIQSVTFLLGGSDLPIGRAHKCGDVINPWAFPIILGGVYTKSDSSALHTQ